MKKHLITTSIIALAPLITLAQPANDVQSLVQFLVGIFNNRLIPLIITLALIYVIYSTVQFIGSPADSQGKDEKKQQIFWGIIGLFVIITVWSLVAVIANTFNIFGGGVLKPR